MSLSNFLKNVLLFLTSHFAKLVENQWPFQEYFSNLMTASLPFKSSSTLLRLPAMMNRRFNISGIKSLYPFSQNNQGILSTRMFLCFQVFIHWYSSSHLIGSHPRIYLFHLELLKMDKVCSYNEECGMFLKANYYSVCSFYWRSGRKLPSTSWLSVFLNRSLRCNLHT